MTAPTPRRPYLNRRRIDDLALLAIKARALVAPGAQVTPVALTPQERSSVQRALEYLDDLAAWRRAVKAARAAAVQAPA